MPEASAGSNKHLKIASERPKNGCFNRASMCLLVLIFVAQSAHMKEELAAPAQVPANNGKTRLNSMHTAGREPAG